MIRFVEREKDRQKLLSLCDNKPFGCKIASIATVYGFDRSFACFWLDTEEDVVYCLVDGAMLVSGTVIRGEAARAFLQMTGTREVLCAVRNAEAMGLAPADTGDVLKRVIKSGKVPGPPPPVNIREIFTLLEENGMVEEFEPFYLDLSHKLRHHGALALTVPGGEGLKACGVVSSISESGAILSALAVAADHRRQGIGSALVRCIESYFPGKTLYVFREQNKNREFYKALGYTKVDTWVHTML